MDARPTGPLLIALHWLGGSARTWSAVATELERFGLPTAALDLPGFGDSADLEGYSVAEMRDHVIAAVQSLRGTIDGFPWILAGHSMGGKVALAVARAALDGTPGLEHLGGLVLVSPSPPSPEPIDESKRAQMLATLGQPAPNEVEARENAQRFVLDNVGKLALPLPLERLATGDVLRANPAAFRAWLESGSKEDWAGRIGTVDLPALVFAGEKEPKLGPDAQREFELPHLPQALLVPLEAAGHLGPLERPAEIAAHIAEFAAVQGWLAAPTESTLHSGFRTLIDGPHTSPATRQVLEHRLAQPTAWHQPNGMPRELFLTHRALVDSIVPVPDFDLAARVDDELSSGSGDGFRPASLPTDAEAWSNGLRSLDAAARHTHSVSFLALDADRRHELLLKASDGALDARSLLGHLHLGSTADLYSAAQMKLWFEEARSLVTRLYMADPRTYQRVGFTGFADDPAGFTHITLNSDDAQHAEHPERGVQYE